MVTGGAELAHSRHSWVVRDDAGRPTVTEGPYAESAEQLTGFYLVRTDDLDDLLRLAGMLADGDGPVEVRRTVRGAGRLVKVLVLLAEDDPEAWERATEAEQRRSSAPTSGSRQPRRPGARSRRARPSPGRPRRGRCARGPGPVSAW